MARKIKMGLFVVGSFHDLIRRAFKKFLGKSWYPSTQIEIALKRKLAKTTKPNHVLHCHCHTHFSIPIIIIMNKLNSKNKHKLLLPSYGSRGAAEGAGADADCCCFTRR